MLIKKAFNQKFLMSHKEIELLIIKHRGYKNFQRLIKEVQKEREKSAVENMKQQERIRKDIYSIETIQSMLVEKVKADRTIDWVKYTLKGKTI
jgi:hypothetical protein